MSVLRLAYQLSDSPPMIFVHEECSCEDHYMGFIVVSRTVQVRITTTAKHGVHCSFEECSGGECCNSPAWDAATAQHGIHCSFKECSGEDHYNS